MMGKVRLAYCVYVENPYGDPEQLVREQKYRPLFTAALEFGERLNACFGKIPRTHFCVGSHLEAFARIVEPHTIRKIYAPPRVEVGNHTYSHALLAPVRGIDGWYPRKVLHSSTAVDELSRTNTILKRVLGARGPFGFSAPCGSHAPLPREMTEAIAQSGCTYSNSYTRGADGGFFAPLKEGGILRQPFRYNNGLPEIPLSGWQDIFNFPCWFRALHRLRHGVAWPRTEEEILRWWGEFLDGAIVESDHREIYLTHMLHPAFLAGIPFIDRWGITHAPKGYDPELRILRAELEMASERGVVLTTVGAIAERLR